MNSRNDNQGGGPGSFGGFPSDDSGAPGFGDGLGSTAGSSPGFGSRGSGFSASPSGGFGGGEKGTSSSGFALDDGSTAPKVPDFSEPQPTATATGPWGWVIAAAVTAIVGLLLGGYTLFATAYSDSLRPVTAGIGWFLAGILSFVLLGVHVTEDTKRQAAGPYIGTIGQVYLYRASVAIGLLGVILTAVALAQWIGVQR